MDVLVGHTGFVGGVLARRRRFDACLASPSVGLLRGASVRHLVCAGVSAVKWKANQEPEADLAGIRRLWDVLETVRAERVTLISTIDVLDDPAGAADETAPATGAAGAYGRNRRWLEMQVQGRFPASLVVRLPALFGPGLKKNVLYDMARGNLLPKIHPEGVFQWYDVAWLADDVDRAWSLGLPLVHLFPEPVRTRVLRDAFFPGLAIGEEVAHLPPPVYGAGTAYAPAFGRGGQGRFLAAAEVMMGRIGLFLRGEGWA
jgi:hypothetical protein